MSSTLSLIRQFKRGRRVAGNLYQLPNGEKLYLAARRTKQIYCGKERTISDAIRNGTACWSIEDEIVLRCRAQEVRFVGVECKDTKDIFITSIERFFDREVMTMQHIPGMGSVQRLVPIQHFRRRPGKTRL